MGSRQAGRKNSEYGRDFKSNSQVRGLVQLWKIFKLEHSYSCENGWQSSRVNKGEKMEKERFCLEIESISANEQFARVVAAAYAARLNPTVEEIEDLKAAVSEAVTNCVIHAYEDKVGTIRMSGSINGRMLTLKIEDKGKGIADIPRAMAPFYTSKPQEERSGMGFTFMQSFVNEVKVESSPGQGTVVTLKKQFLPLPKDGSENE